MNPSLHNDSFARLMRKAKLEIPFGDFEETVMQQIHEETTRKQVVSRDRKLSFVFFLLGTTFGLWLNYLLQKSPLSFLDLPSETVVLIFQAGFVLVFLIQLEKNIPLLRQWKNIPHSSKKEIRPGA